MPDQDQVFEDGLPMFNIFTADVNAQTKEKVIDDKKGRMTLYDTTKNSRQIMEEFCQFQVYKFKTKMPTLQFSKSSYLELGNQRLNS